MLAGLLLVVGVGLFAAFACLGSLAWDWYWRREEERCQREWEEAIGELTQFARAAMWEGKRHLGNDEQRERYKPIEEKINRLVARKAYAMQMRGAAPDGQAEHRQA